MHTSDRMSNRVGGNDPKMNSMPYLDAMPSFAGLVPNLTPMPAAVSLPEVLGWLSAAQTCGGPLPPSFSGDSQACPCPGYVPPPSPDMACAPSGGGLTQSGNTVTTSGGYKIVAEGKEAAWSIYGPDGKKLTRIHGDPHVSEADGGKWDFHKNSAFVLPDGTRIFAKTVPSPKFPGNTVTSGLDIANGNDRISVDGINSKEPKFGEMTHDGIDAWRNEHQNAPSYVLEGDSTHQKWEKRMGTEAWDDTIRGKEGDGPQIADAMQMLRTLLFGTAEQQQQIFQAMNAQPMRL